jgi:hypothetical protein
LKIFDKTITEYFDFQKPIMILIITVGLLRLALSLAGLPDSIVTYLSLTALGLVGVVYCGIMVPLKRFGSYKHLLPLFVMQALPANIIIAAGIAITALTGITNIFSSPEHSGPLVNRPWLHAGGHLLDGLIVGPLLGWLLGSALMFVTKRLSPVSATRRETVQSR